VEKVTNIEAEIAYLKKSQTLDRNLESLKAKRKSEIITEQIHDHLTYLFS
jgi:phage shock protein A